jgi:acyl-coenzyme A synthetase/AMP-(fatty) acid ligase
MSELAGTTSATPVIGPNKPGRSGGDVARMDDDGYFTIVDRMNDMILS